jgi:hypothetical protein
MEDDTTKRYPRTMHEAFNCDSDPISGPYGKHSLAPLAVIIFVIVFAIVLLVWGRT